MWKVLKKREKWFSTRYKPHEDLLWEQHRAVRLQGSYQGSVKHHSWQSAFVNELGINVSGELVKLLMTENMKQPQDKGRWDTTQKKSSQQQKVAVTGTNDQTFSYKLAGSSYFHHWITQSEKCSPGRQQERCSPGWAVLEERLSHFILQSKCWEQEDFSA